MKPSDLPQLQNRLNELADYYDRKHPSAGALKVWLDALGECQIDDVLFVLVDWPKSHRQMPLADEVLKLCRERLSDRIEQKAAQEKAEWKGASLDKILRTPQSSDIAHREMAKIRAILSKPKAGPKEWARRILRGERPKAGSYAYELARKVVGEKPESDADREARLEREAIQAEAV